MIRDKIMIRIKVRPGIHGWNLCYRRECHSIGFHSQYGAYHVDMEDYLSRSHGMSRDVTNRRYVTWE